MAKSLRELRASWSGRASNAEKLVIYHFDQDDPVAESTVRSLLNEQHPRVDLGKGRSIIFHRAHIPSTEDHLHFLVKGAKIAAINQSGTAHDRSHGVQLQRWALDGMQQYYPDFKLPPDGLIEALMDKSLAPPLNEAVDKVNILLVKSLSSATPFRVQYRPLGA